MENEKLNNIRHTLAHLLAQAVLEAHPDAKLTIGPTTDDGFYYDFADVVISEDELPAIEKAMRAIASRNLEIRHEQWPIEKARHYFQERNEPYKLELIDELGKDLVAHSPQLEATVGIAFTGSEFTDLCRGGHVENTKDIPLDAFKLTRVAGAYWRGDEKNAMLTRVYGVAFETRKELEEYEAKLEEAKNRDHRKLGAELDLFTFSDLVGAGLPLFTPRGTAMREALLDFLWELSKKYGYQKVTIPHITKIDLYETSGHADKFRDEFFAVHGNQSGQNFVMKPMNCPHHTQIYASHGRSYRDLPLRYKETSVQYRDEKPGELLGLSRVRAITVDDAHLFCRPDQIKEEVGNIVKIIEGFYSTLGMWNKGENFWVSLSVRDPKNLEKYLGKDENWNRAEQYLEEVAKEHGLDATRKEGEAAFYGPK
ncbi:MAG: threonine--tRNA ligase, partial [Candidatus Spechtbacterales bacterium]